MSDARADDLSALRTIIVRAVRESTGMHERLAVPVAFAIIETLQREHGTQRLYIPAPTRAQRDQAIRDAAALGLSIDDICRAYRCHRATAYRALRKQDATTGAA